MSSAVIQWFTTCPRMTGRWSGLKKEGFKQCEVMVTRARTAIIYRFMIKGGRKEKEEWEKRKEKEKENNNN